VVTNVDDQAKAASLGADAYSAKPVDRRWLLGRLRELTGLVQPRALIIDDEEAPRYALRSLLGQLDFDVEEAPRPADALRRVSDDPPDVVFLDLVMPELTGFEVLGRLRADAATRRLPVVVTTSKVLVPGEERELAGQSAPVLSKEVWSRPDALARIRAALAAAGWAPVHAATQEQS
jgi:CheY-like chemotaxis protein